MIQEPTLLGSGFDHRQDAGLQGFGQSGPCIDHGGQVGVCYCAKRGSNFGSSRSADWAGFIRLHS